MKNITIVYMNQNGEKKSEHISHANTEKIQTFLDNQPIYALEQIIEQHVSLGINEFKIHASQDDLVSFVKEWSLNY